MGEAYMKLTKAVITNRKVMNEAEVQVKEWIEKRNRARTEFYVAQNALKHFVRETSEFEAETEKESLKKPFMTGYERMENWRRKRAERQAVAAKLQHPSCRCAPVKVKSAFDDDGDDDL